MLPIMACWSYASVFIAEEALATEAQAGTAISMITLFSAVSSLLYGRIAAFFKRLLPAFGFGCIALAFVFLLLFRSYATVIIGLAFLGLSMGILVPYVLAGAAMASSLERQTMAQSIVLCGTYAGQFLSSVWYTLATWITGLFDNVNENVSQISGQIGQTPQGWNADIFSMIQTLSETVILPIAGVILAIVMTLELIQIITDHNNFHEIETAVFFKWMFKSACAILIVTNTWTIVMGIFDAAQQVVAQAAGVVVSDATVDISTMMDGLEERLMEMDIGQLFGLWFQSLFVNVTAWAVAICIFIVIYGRMLEVYLTASIAPIPMATMMGKEFGGMGQNYLRSLLALAFQAFLIIVCVAIYAVLVQNIALDEDVSKAIWTCMGYTVLLCFTLFKTSSMARSIFAAH